MLIGVDVDELQHALGVVVLEAAYMERSLRAAFSALIGSKYAAVVDGRLMAAALIEDCEQITRYHTDLSGSAKQALLAALRACHEANGERNRVIHDTWATRPGNVMVTLHGDRKSHDVTVTIRTLTAVRQLADQIASAADRRHDCRPWRPSGHSLRINCAVSSATTSAPTPEPNRLLIAEVHTSCAVGHPLMSVSGFAVRQTR